MYKKISLILVLLLTLLTGSLYTGQVLLTGSIFPWQNQQPKVVQELRIGLLPIEESLPFLVAQEEGYFSKKELQVKLIPFSSALELNSALQAKEIDGLVSDLVASAYLEDNGLDISIVSLCLGATPQEGRVALLAAPGSKITEVKELAGVPIAISNNSLIEYVADRLLSKGKVAPQERKYVIVRPLPIRLEMLLKDQVQAAVLPDPLAQSAIKKGARLLAADTETEENISQSVLLFRQAFLEANPKQVKNFLQAYAEGVKAINAQPETYRAALFKQAGIPENIAHDYAINKFPLPQVPSPEMVNQVLNWLKKRGLISAEISYGKLVSSQFAPSR